jgi:predicted TIM-barrel fold metal-dependent hydrolase
MKRYPWVKYLKRSQPELPYDSPIYLGNWTNGEFFHEQTPHERRVREEILRVGAEKARRLNMDRREFMASAMGMVTTLSVIQACSAPTSQSAGGARSVPTIPSQGGSPGSSGQGATLPGQASVGLPTSQNGGPAGMPGSSGGMSGGPGMGAAGQPNGGASAHMVGTDPGAPGQYCFDKDSGVDPTMCDQAAREILKPAQFIFDAQTHCFEDDPNATWRKSPPPGFNDSLSSLLFGKCSSDPVMCVGPDDYVRLMFLQSDTTMTVLSAWPYGQGPSDPNSNVFLAKTRDWINKDLAASSRVVNHASVVPWIGVSGMDMAAQMLRVAGWKLYPAAPGNLYKMDDKTGRAFIERGIKLGVKTFSIHKGLPISGFSEPHNLPDDIGPVAKDYPDCNFVVYHSAICAGQTGMGFTCTPMEGPYVMGSKVNSDALITSLLDNGIKPNSNVFAEMGGAFSQLMANPTAAGQWLGKLVQYVGDRNVVWGTDSILTGTSPQGQIQAFMGLQHPMLTPQVKQQILGTNLARLYCVDPMEKRCQVDKSKVAMLKREQDAEFGDYRWVLLGHQRTLGPTTRREFIGMVRWEDSKHRPG